MNKYLNISYEEYIGGFRELIGSIGLKNTSQREYILKILFESSKHLSAEEMQEEIKNKDNTVISMPTIYKILKLLEELKVVKGISLEGFDSKLYELDIVSHHDHMVCVSCGNITEFFNTELEDIQEYIAKESGFHLQTHTMVMYGKCKTCYEVDNNS